jgi:trans-2,3-dihydro-3-hydroxyanthranilate isomerase
MTGQKFCFSVVDVFALELLNGKPLAQVVDAQQLSRETMQRIARKSNQMGSTI